MASQAVSSRWRLDGYRVLVTGSTKGIGHACATEMYSLGASVMITARSADEVARVVQEMKDQSPGGGAREEADGRVFGCAADISTEEGRDKLIQAVSRQWGGALDCLVNNAGTNVRKSVVDATPEEYTSIMRTNMDSCYFLCKKAYDLLSNSSRPTVINVSSVAGVNSTGSGGIYAMSKAAVVQLTKTLACEWAKVGIRVNCVAPWVTLTPLLAEALKTNPSSLEKAKAWTPM
eukprot:CAMPEP_0197848760 /NCGR_PEP_ID=MMETSP1438-20131217/9933_1 /TAXON_ID=1461541 /ORGANISM="Pterosperma sp., Strain CCMP1384" /LENGTH=232 /DNA_ID=CAMNT_0043461157 /DNA_START=84 /DNA_END=779 /DNA_ORIENTATION=+